MKKLTDKKTAFSKEEFSILLRAASIDRLICFAVEDFPKVNEMGAGRYNQCLFDLAARGVLVSDGENIRVTKDYALLMRCIADCRRILMINAYTEDASSQCLYISEEGCVAAFPGVQASEYLLLQMVDRERLAEYLSAQMGLPEEMYSEEMKMLLEHSGRKLPVAEELEDLQAELRLSLSFYDPQEDEPDTELRLVLYEGVLYEVSDGEVRYYAKKEFADSVMRAIKEGDKK